MIALSRVQFLKKHLKNQVLFLNIMNINYGIDFSDVTNFIVIVAFDSVNSAHLGNDFVKFVLAKICFFLNQSSQDQLKFDQLQSSA
jgi:hypothetical protein